MKSNKLKSCEGYAMTFVAAVLAILIAVSLAGMAEAGTVCRQQVVAHQQYAAPLLAPYYFKIGAGVEQEAVATQQFRHSDEYIELQQLRGFKAGVDAVASVSGDRPSSPHQPPSEGHDATDGGQTTPPAAPTSEFAARYPTLAANCTRCHDKDDPPKGVFISPTVPLEGPDAAVKRDALARAMVNGRMPENKPLDDQSTFNALIELFSEPTPPEGE